MTSILAPLEQVVSHFIVAVHSVLAHLFGSHGGWAWALAIVALVAVIRILLFPLFAKQSRSMRQMQLLQPKVKELQRKYADDKQTQQQELMKLYKETGVNPLGGCLPLIVQGPIFFALYRVLYNVKPDFKHVTGMTQPQAQDAGTSTLFGAPISAAFSWTDKQLHQLESAPYFAHVASLTTIKIVTAAFIVAMSAATFVTTRQSMARSQAAQAKAGAAENPMMRQQKFIMYAMPLFLLFFGYRVPLGALIYWLSNNVFTMVQQHFLYRKMEAEAAGAGAAAGAGGTGATVRMPGPARAGAQPLVGTGGGTGEKPGATAGDDSGRPREAAPTPGSADTAAGGPVQRPWQSGPARRPPAGRTRGKRSRRR